MPGVGLIRHQVYIADLERILAASAGKGTAKKASGVARARSLTDCFQLGGRPLLAAGYGDGTIRIFDAGNHAGTDPLRNSQQHTQLPRAVEHTPDAWNSWQKSWLEL